MHPIHRVFRIPRPWEWFDGGYIPKFVSNFPDPRVVFFYFFWSLRPPPQADLRVLLISFSFSIIQVLGLLPSRWFKLFWIKLFPCRWFKLFWKLFPSRLISFSFSMIQVILNNLNHPPASYFLLDDSNYSESGGTDADSSRAVDHEIWKVFRVLANLESVASSRKTSKLDRDRCLPTAHEWSNRTVAEHACSKM